MTTWAFRLEARRGKGERVGAEIISLGPDHPGRLKEAAEGSGSGWGDESPTKPPVSPSWAWLAETLRIYKQVHIQGVAVNPGETL